MTSTDQVCIRELIAWGLDANDFRPASDALLRKVESARLTLARRPEFEPSDPVLEDVPPVVRMLLERQSQRADLALEMHGLAWSIGVVDLRKLVAFQRRLIFDEAFPSAPVPAPDDWAALTALAFGPPVDIAYRTVAVSEKELLLQSTNPNLQFRSTPNGRHAPLQLHGGSPFLEVAEFRGRWFLRDGYHRAFRLLRAGVTQVPAVLVRAMTLAELGPVQPWFFGEDALFGPRPPCVVDMLNDELTMEYQRPRLYKTVRVSMEETLEPALFDDDSKTVTEGEQA